MRRRYSSTAFSTAPLTQAKAESGRAAVGLPLMLKATSILDRQRAVRHHSQLATDSPAKGDYGDSIIKLAVDSSTTATHQNQNGWGFKVVDYFTPFDQNLLNIGDVDLASGGRDALAGFGGQCGPPELDARRGQGRPGLSHRPKQHGPLQPHDRQCGAACQRDRRARTAHRRTSMASSTTLGATRIP